MIRKYLQKFLKAEVTKSKFLDFARFDNTDSTNLKVGVEAYRRNVIVNRCVNIISQSASHVPWMVGRNNSGVFEKIPNHPAYSLLKKPNAEKAGADFFCEVIASKLLYGNSYILVTLVDNFPREIYLLPSSDTELIFDRNYPVGYKYRNQSIEKIYLIDSISRVSRVLHLKNYNPSNAYDGLSSLDPASLSISLHTEATKWNRSLLKNGARPSGALIVKESNGYLGDEQFDRLQEQLNEKFTGSHNSGKPLLLEGGLAWQEISINPKDMDFIESKNIAAREIALAFGIPPQLLGINGDNTYSNMQEARLALWEETLIPLLDKLSDALGSWLSYWYQEEIIIDFDRDAISALTERRQNLWGKISTANFMTVNEKRSLVGLAPIEGFDTL